MQRWLRRLPWIGVGLVLVGGLVYAFLPEPVPVDVAHVSRGSLLVTVNEDGKTRIRDRYVVSAPLSGRLLRVELDPGDVVRANETVLAMIEPSSPELLDERQIAEAQARVSAAEAALKRSGTVLDAALAAMQVAESNLGRVKRLSGTAATEAELEAAQLDFRVKTEEYRAARFGQEIAEFELDQARAALTRSAPDGRPPGESWNFPIHSPIDGEVLRVFEESMTVVTPGMRLLEVGDPHDLEMEIDVLSTDGVRIDPGDRVIVEHWGGEHSLEGIVRLIEPSAFTKVSALGVEEQRVNVIADFIGPPEKRTSLGDAFRIEARVVIWEESDVLKVPTSALFREAGEWAVFVLHDGRARLRPVTIGRQSGLEAQVLDGLKEGDVVIVNPGDRIQDGIEAIARNGDPR